MMAIGSCNSAACVDGLIEDDLDDIDMLIGIEDDIQREQELERAACDEMEQPEYRNFRRCYKIWGMFISESAVRRHLGRWKHAELVIKHTAVRFDDAGQVGVPPLTEAFYSSCILPLSFSKVLLL
mmetsp:Transcript_15690/g.30977  ORF Transcript_15690/g.30977 Transcript_15690/m.30977 type:complete len:125 (+) Transcript_15690:285-659(+)